MHLTCEYTKAAMSRISTENRSNDKSVGEETILIAEKKVRLNEAMCVCAWNIDKKMRAALIWNLHKSDNAKAPAYYGFTLALDFVLKCSEASNLPKNEQWNASKK